MQQLWFKIGDAARIIGVTPKDLRYWELNLESFKSRRSQGNLRYYHRDDLPIFENMKRLIESGLSIREAAQEASKPNLSSGSPTHDVIAEDRALPITVDLQNDSTAGIKRRDQIEDAKASLREMIDQLSRPINIT
ncbi:hypothetical protein LBMAG01_07480 [Acidobacteriota bacterium]|nr:hypothetical protein LBMAG01_07480 [Acidobacteriota bacterium]